MADRDSFLAEFDHRHCAQRPHHVAPQCFRKRGLRKSSLFVFDKNVAPGREVMFDSNLAGSRMASDGPSKGAPSGN
jgi:hypothetical protein